MPDTKPQPARLYYGWIVAAVSTFGMIATAPGQTMLVGLLALPIQNDLGLTQSQIAQAYLFGTVLAALPLVYAGRLSDRFGPRIMIAAIAVLFGIGCVVLGQAHNYATLLVGYFLVRFLGQGSLGLASQHALAMWFHRRLGLVNGLKTVTLFLAWSTFPALLTLLIETQGWRNAYAILGIAVAVTIAPLSLILMRNKPEDIGQQLDGDLASEPDPLTAPVKPTEPHFTLKQAYRTAAFWLVAMVIVIQALVGTAILFNIQPMFVEADLDPEYAAGATSAWLLGSAICAVPAGWCADRFRPNVLLCISLCAMATTALGLAAAEQVWQAFAAMGSFSIGFSLIAAVGTTTIARYYGRPHHGAIRAAVGRLTVAGTGVGPFAQTWLKGSLGSFDASLVVFAGMCVVMALVVLTLRRPEAPNSDTPNREGPRGGARGPSD